MSATLAGMPRLLQCTGKEAFTSASIAARVAKKFSASKRRKGQLRRKLESYRCAHCGLFHIGGRVGA